PGVTTPVEMIGAVSSRPTSALAPCGAANAAASSSPMTMAAKRSLEAVLVDLDIFPPALDSHPGPGKAPDGDYMRDRRRRIGCSGRLLVTDPGAQADSGRMSDREQRVERVVFETDRHLIAGDMILPASGYQGRFSDSINRGEFEFVQLINVEITSLEHDETSRQPFVAL